MSSRPSRVPMVVALSATALLVVVLVIAGIAVVPQLIRAAATEVAASDTSVVLVADGVEATIPVDAGWSYVVGPFDDAHATLRSPDGAMTVELMATSGDAEQAARVAADGALSPFDREPVGAATVLHARVVGEDAIVGAVVSGDAAVVFSCRPGAAYEAELARLLARVEVTP